MPARLSRRISAGACSISGTCPRFSGARGRLQQMLRRGVGNRHDILGETAAGLRQVRRFSRNPATCGVWRNSCVSRRCRRIGGRNVPADRTKSAKKPWRRTGPPPRRSRPARSRWNRPDAVGMEVNQARQHVTAGRVYLPARSDSRARRLRLSSRVLSGLPPPPGGRQGKALYHCESKAIA